MDLIMRLSEAMPLYILLVLFGQSSCAFLYVPDRGRKETTFLRALFSGLLLDHLSTRRSLLCAEIGPRSIFHPILVHLLSSSSVVDTNTRRVILFGHARPSMLCDLGPVSR